MALYWNSCWALPWAAVSRAQGNNNFNATLLLRALSRRPASQSGTSSKRQISSPHFPLSSNPLKPPSPRDFSGRALCRYILKPPPHHDLRRSGSHVTGLLQESFICGYIKNGFNLAAQMVPPPTSHTEHVSSLQRVAKINKLTHFVLPLLVFTQVIHSDVLLTPANWRQLWVSLM